MKQEMDLALKMRLNYLLHWNNLAESQADSYLGGRYGRELVAMLTSPNRFEVLYYLARVMHVHYVGLDKHFGFVEQVETNDGIEMHTYDMECPCRVITTILIGEESYDGIGDNMVAAQDADVLLLILSRMHDVLPHIPINQTPPEEELQRAYLEILQSLAFEESMLYMYWQIATKQLKEHDDNIFRNLIQRVQDDYGV